MNRGKLSRREARARMRFIQEHHYNGEEQRIMDRAVAQMGVTYVELYRKVKNGHFYIFMNAIHCRRLGKAMASVNSTVEDAIWAFSCLAKAIFPIVAPAIQVPAPILFPPEHRAFARKEQSNV